jgi:hypothetical protein
MTELTDAAERLARAVARLETLAPHQDSTELTRLRAEYAALEHVTDTVSNRLDGAIERLKAALD